MSPPDPAAVSAAPTVPAPELLDELRRLVRGDVDASTLRRAEYSGDASNYRVVPQVVVVPRDVDDLVAVHRVARWTPGRR